MTEYFMLQKAYKLFDTANSADPNLILVNGEEQPKELVFALRLTYAVLTLCPDPSVPLRLAARCQHICRWQVPRSTQPMDRAGYLKWRAGLKKFHAETSANLLREVGFDEATIERVESLNQKKNLKTDPECQIIEDALCLVFLQYQFDHLIESTEDEKMIKIVQKTWAKMSKEGQTEALQLNYSDQAKEVLNRAL